jgi:lipoprotein-anchoring transpeptidase ErfK/SrfK
MFRSIALAVTLAVAASPVTVFAEPVQTPSNAAPAAAAPPPAGPAASSTGAPAAAAPAAQPTLDGKGGDTKPAQAAVAEPPPAPKPRPLPPTLTASVDLSRQVMTVSVNGEPRYRWPISSGTSQFPTPTGNFVAQRSARMWYSRQYDNAPMPNAVFINGGVAVHGTEYVRSLGRPASHGCIRLAPGNARTFYNLVEKHGLMRTRVKVQGRPDWRDDAVASRRDRRDDDYASNDSFWFFGSSNRYDDDDRRARRSRERAERRSHGKYAVKDSGKRRRSYEE